MNNHIRTQVLVVGAGAAGLLAARAIVDQGLECVVIEKKKRAAWGDRWCVEVDQRTLGSVLS